MVRITLFWSGQAALIGLICLLLFGCASRTPQTGKRLINVGHKFLAVTNVAPFIIRRIFVGISTEDEQYSTFWARELTVQRLIETYRTSARDIGEISYWPFARCFFQFQYFKLANIHIIQFLERRGRFFRRNVRYPTVVTKLLGHLLTSDRPLINLLIKRKCVIVFPRLFEVVHVYGKRVVLSRVCPDFKPVEFMYLEIKRICASAIPKNQCNLSSTRAIPHHGQLRFQMGEQTNTGYFICVIEDSGISEQDEERQPFQQTAARLLLGFCLVVATYPLAVEKGFWQIESAGRDEPKCLQKLISGMFWLTIAWVVGHAGVLLLFFGGLDLSLGALIL